MAVDPQAVRFLEGLYSRVDTMVRDILASIPGAMDTYDINIQFDGGGAPLAAGAAGQVELPMSGRIMAARLFVGPADGASSATITAQIGTFADYPTGLPLEGDGAIPTLTTDVKVDLDVRGWVQNIYTRDILAYTLTSFSGSAIHLTLALLVRKMPGVVASAASTEARASRVMARMARSLRNGSAV